MPFRGNPTKLEDIVALLDERLRAIEVAIGGSITDHGSLEGLQDEDHPQYLLKRLLEAKGDLISASAENVPLRLPVGSNTQVLTADSAEDTGLKWVATGSVGITDHGALTGLGDDDHTQYILETLAAAKGDILVATGNDTFVVLTVGSDGDVLTADSGEATGVKWDPAGSATGWQDDGTVVRLVTTTDQVVIGDSANDPRDPSLYVKGRNTTNPALVVNGSSSLTNMVHLGSGRTDLGTDEGIIVSGAGRITFRSRSASAAFSATNLASSLIASFGSVVQINGAGVRLLAGGILEAADGTDTVSSASEGRLRYDSATQKWQVSENTGAWVSIVSGGAGVGGHVIQEDGGSLTQRANLNFVEGLLATDDVGNDQTDVNIDWAEVGDITGDINIGDAAAAGTGTEAARGDHQHAHPAPTAGYPLDVAAAESDGAATTPARSDHVHAHGSGYLPDAHHNQAHTNTDHTDYFSSVNVTEVGTGAATAETDLQTRTLPANTLGTTGGIEIVATGDMSGTAGGRTVRLYFGATELIEFVRNATVDTSVDWILRAWVYSDGATNAQKICVFAVVGDNTIEFMDYLTAAIDTTADVTIKTTGTTSSSADEITSQVLHVRRIV